MMATLILIIAITLVSTLISAGYAYALPAYKKSQEQKRQIAADKAKLIQATQLRRAQIMLEESEKSLQREIYGTSMLQIVQAAERKAQDEYDEYHKDDPEVVAEREAMKAKVREAIMADLDNVNAAERERQEKDLAVFAEWVAQQAWKENFDKQIAIRNALEPFGSPVYDKFRPGAEVDSYSLDEVQSIKPLEGDWDELITRGNDLAIYDPTCHYCKVIQLKPTPDGNGHVGVLEPCERHVYRVEDE